MARAVLPPPLCSLLNRSVRRLTNDASATPTVHIDWGKYGNYELVMAEDGQSMAGSAKGQPDNWRKAKRLGSIDAGESAHSHGH